VQDNETVIVHEREHQEARRQFVSAFLETEQWRSYPRDETDLRDEKARSRRPVVLWKTVAEDIERVYELCTSPHWYPHPERFAKELLESVVHDHLCPLAQLPVHLLSLELVLAHVESLPYRLRKREAGSVARRTFLALLNWATAPEVSSSTEAKEQHERDRWRKDG
jgi:hypothetical protein